MKKIIYFLVAFIVFALSFNTHVANTSQNTFSAITLQNIEALSNSEFPDMTCYGVGSVDCPNENMKVRVVV